MKKITVQVASILLIMLIGTACGRSASEPVAFDVELSEFAFSPSTLQAKVGQEVTLNLVNTGGVEHELMIGREVNLVDNRPNGFHSDLFEVGNVDPEINGGTFRQGGGEGHAHGGTMVVVQPGEQATIRFRVTRAMLGEWELGCFSQQGTHYDARMAGEFVVSP